MLPITTRAKDKREGITCVSLQPETTVQHVTPLGRCEQIKLRFSIYYLRSNVVFAELSARVFFSLKTFSYSIPRDGITQYPRVRDKLLYAMYK